MVLLNNENPKKLIAKDIGEGCCYNYCKQPRLFALSLKCSRSEQANKRLGCIMSCRCILQIVQMPTDMEMHTHVCNTFVDCPVTFRNMPRNIFTSNSQLATFSVKTAMPMLHCLLKQKVTGFTFGLTLVVFLPWGIPKTQESNWWLSFHHTVMNCINVPAKSCRTSLQKADWQSVGDRKHPFCLYLRSESEIQSECLQLHQNEVSEIKDTNCC